MTSVSFKISSSLKDIIGKDLITDDFIAVFELVKNSFDANATKVEIVFQDLHSSKPKIIIKDNGDGMDEDDIMNKWLFVAYSSKKNYQDYRDRIKSERIYAGAKGIGRFSCDRLGSQLKLITKKKDINEYFILDVDWSKFENNSKDEFHTVEVELDKQNDIFHDQFESGTILEITSLRSKDWGRDKLLRLRRSLERLINPNQGNDIDNFSIVLDVPDELKVDQNILKESKDEPWRIVNGPIKNFLFEALELKTTQIRVEIDKDGQFIFTQLIDRGTLIYELLEQNPYPQILHDIRIILFFLNRSAKVTFTRYMGLQPINYGSVFLYKNGFRVHPFGDVGNDSLEIDRRKQQAIFRNLGSRELSGRIEINGRNNGFQETSSRDGGFIKNESLSSLKELFFEYALKRLENYVIELNKFGRGLENSPEIKDPNSIALREFTFNLISKLTQSKNIVDISYDPNVLNVLESRSSDSLTVLLKNLKKISSQQNNDKLQTEISKVEKHLSDLAKAREEAEAETKRQRERARQAEEEAKESKARAQEAEAAAQASEETVEVLRTQNLFLSSAVSKDLQHVIELHHSIGQDTKTIEQFAANLLTEIKESGSVNIGRLRLSLEKITLVSRKIYTVSRFATRANFQADAEDITTDIVGYIREYLLNIYGDTLRDPYKQKINISFNSNSSDDFITNFAPIKVSMILDNLINNARKHKSKNIDISVIEKTNDHVLVSFKNDGHPIPSHYMPSLFQIGFTTTDGSGLGLHHSRSLMNDMNGTITVNETLNQGAEFFLKFTKQ
jgi:signal transduction histidine kinase